MVAVDLNAGIDALLACATSALEAALRPVCACHQSIGTPMWSPCCECDSRNSTGTLSAWLENMYPADANTLLPVTRTETCRRGAWAADIAIQLSRCFPTVDEHGNLPSTEDVDAVARSLHEDAVVVRRAITCCGDVRLRWRTLGVEAEPEGGCSYLVARVTIEVQ